MSIDADSQGAIKWKRGQRYDGQTARAGLSVLRRALVPPQRECSPELRFLHRASCGNGFGFDLLDST
ncbi:TPA: hypothetical protein ACH3X2_000445 [Trebouxia sp. C0005]